MESVQLTTSDGHELRADVAGPAGRAIGAVAICHPHPRYGGNRFNVVVDAMFRTLPTRGLVALRFDFRVEHGGGTAERLDVVAALDELATRAVGPLAVAGYSFGATVALATRDSRIGAVAAVAPPLSMTTVAPPTAPTLVLTPRHDQFTPPADAEPVVATWPDADFAAIESADHFLAGHTTAVADAVADWLVERLGG